MLSYEPDDEALAPLAELMRRHEASGATEPFSLIQAWLSAGWQPPDSFVPTPSTHHMSSSFAAAAGTSIGVLADLMNGGQGGGFGIATQLARHWEEEDADAGGLSSDMQSIERVTAEHRVVQAASSPGSMRPQVQQLYNALRRLASSQAATTTAAGTGGASSSLGGRLATGTGSEQREKGRVGGGAAPGSSGALPAPAAAGPAGANPTSNPQQRQRATPQAEEQEGDLMDWFEERVEEEEAAAAGKPYVLPGEDFHFSGHPQVGTPFGR